MPATRKQPHPHLQALCLPRETPRPPTQALQAVPQRSVVPLNRIRLRLASSNPMPATSIVQRSIHCMPIGAIRYHPWRAVAPPLQPLYPQLIRHHQAQQASRPPLNTGRKVKRAFFDPQRCAVRLTQRCPHTPRWQAKAAPAPWQRCPLPSPSSLWSDGRCRVSTRCCGCCVHQSQGRGLVGAGQEGSRVVLGWGCGSGGSLCIGSATCCCCSSCHA